MGWRETNPLVNFEFFMCIFSTKKAVNVCLSLGNVAYDHADVESDV